MAPGTLISKQKAAHDLDVSVSTIDRLRCAGEIEAIRVGRSVRVLVASLEEYKARQREHANAELQAAPALAPQRRRRVDPFARDAFPIPALDQRRAVRKAA